MNRFVNVKMMLAGALTAVAILGFGAVSTHQANADYIKDCDDNAIMKCGAPDAATFIKNIGTSSYKDLPAIYSYSGVAPKDYARFVSESRPGTVYKDGRVVVDGQVVGTSAISIGRHQKSYSTPGVIAGKTYYASHTKDVFQRDSLPAMVFFDSKGKMVTAILNACGNPVSATPTTPRYSCDMLQSAPVAGKANTYTFSTTAQATNNARITQVVYDFGDGKTVTQTSATAKVTHTYAKPGTYTAKVTVQVALPGKKTATATSAHCQKQITIVQPFQQCLALTAKVVNPKDHSYQFTVTTKQGNGAVLKGAHFDFGDGKSATVAKTTNSTVVTEHEYAKADSYTIKATVTFTTPYGDKVVACQTDITIAPEMCPIKPDVPKDSPECKPCPHNPELPEGSEACVPPETETPPAELPSTGAGSIAGLVASTGIVAGVGHRVVRRRR